MLNDIVDNKILTGKTKDEIIELLDTIGIKQFNYSDNSWMFVISIPNSLATEKAVEIMDIEFEKDKVKQVKIRQWKKTWEDSVSKSATKIYHQSVVRHAETIINTWTGMKYIPLKEEKNEKTVNKIRDKGIFSPN